MCCERPCTRLRWTEKVWYTRKSLLPQTTTTLSQQTFVTIVQPTILNIHNISGYFLLIDSQQIWATGRSTVGSGAESKPHSRNTTLNINGVPISPGDILFADSSDGIVVIPEELVNDVIDLMPRLVQADDRVKADVQAGSTVAAAFKKHRGR